MESTSVPQQKDRVDMTEDERVTITTNFVKELAKWPMINRTAAVGFVGEHVAWQANMDPAEFFKILMDCCEERQMGQADGKVH
jgi:hypothetical protein